MSLAECSAHDAPLPTDVAAPIAPVSAVTPLDDALHLLQADPGHSLADPGLSRLTPAALDRLFLAARRQAEQSHDGILLLLDLLHYAAPAGGGHGRLLPRVVHQLRHHVENQQRWQALADNAAYYRDNPQVAERIAARLRPG